MAPRTRRRRRQGALGRAGRRIDRAGQSTLLGLWSLIVRLVTVIYELLSQITMVAWVWWRRRSTIVRLAVLGVIVVAAVSFARWERPLHVDDDSEALARVIRSEAGTQSLQKRLHVAWATRNLAEERGQGIAEMACSPCGPQQRGRPVSSRQEARNVDRELARQVLKASPMLDPTGGATHFINPALQDKLAAEGKRAGYRNRPYRVVRAKWIRAYDWRPYYRLGDDLEMWGPKRGRRPIGR